MAASTAIFSLRTQLNVILLLFAPGTVIVSSQLNAFREEIIQTLRVLLYHKGYQPMIHQVNIHKPIFAALNPDRILPKKLDFGAEFEIEATPKQLVKNFIIRFRL